MIKSRFNYELLAMHIFRYPDRRMCLAEWKRLYSTAPFYVKGIDEINMFFNSVKR